MGNLCSSCSKDHATTSNIPDKRFEVIHNRSLYLNRICPEDTEKIGINFISFLETKYETQISKNDA